MGLFKDFKEDFSQAVNEMMPGGDVLEEEKQQKQPDDLVVNTISEKLDVRSELSKLDGLLEQVKTAEEKTVDLPPIEKEPKPAPKPTPKPEPVPVPEIKLSPIPELKPAPTIPTPAMSAPTISTPTISVPNIPAPTIAKEERRIMSETAGTQTVRPIGDPRVNAAQVTEETSIITAGTTLTGDIASDGSFDVQGTINGNVTCNGKLVVTGSINGNSAASEIFADVAKIEGEVVSSGTVKIGAGSVIIGNISAASAVIAGAIKGDIDVQGPVVVDTSAVIMGNIKSRSVQINNGAVIEGFCSQSYAEIDVEGLFDGR